MPALMIPKSCVDSTALPRVRANPPDLFPSFIANWSGMFPIFFVLPHRPYSFFCFSGFANSLAFSSRVLGFFSFLFLGPFGFPFFYFLGPHGFMSFFLLGRMGLLLVSSQALGMVFLLPPGLCWFPFTFFSWALWVSFFPPRGPSGLPSFHFFGPAGFLFALLSPMGSLLYFYWARRGSVVAALGLLGSLVPS